jgi:endonuclease YncB( thermonuclease family)
MRARSGRVVPFSPSRRRRRRFRPARRRGTLPFAAPILVLAGGLALWLAISPAAPAAWTDFWSGLAGAIATGSWPDRSAAVVTATATLASGAGIETAIPAPAIPAPAIPAPAIPAPAIPAGNIPDGAIAGRASVIDADTLDIHGTRIRLHAVDAPESAQPCFVGSDIVRCGQRAALALDRWIANRSVVCIERDIDRYGRVVASCTVGGEDMGAWLVRSGHAVAYRRYGADYVCDEAAAARERRGIWAMRFVEPAAWRRLDADRQRAAPARSYDPGWPGGCG